MESDGINLLQRLNETHWCEQLFGEKVAATGVTLQAETRGESSRAPPAIATTKAS